MNLLAIDTSSVACSVALQLGADIIERHAEEPREHTRLLIPMIRDVLEEAGVSTSDLDAIVLGNGPGSFIGMRIAASVAQGLAFAAGVKIIPVSSLAVVAAQVFAESDAEQVAVAQDAHMSEVYLGIFQRGASGLPVATGDERLASLSEITELSIDPETERLAAGFGWQRYPDLMQLNASRFSGDSTVMHPHARFLLAIADPAAAIDAENVSPAYLRQKVAEKPASSGS
ncbi:MAG: tRNA (adenosine(37)-N6)-threonylcarbamoyltransferase complex dimerization subunit type 1 TsaB [Gammaproteobacteria bacterium]|nr:tRNA (adenosine(37)-N6)-threonylcarbamoyltransferase complex dimerization subunit type 1 TsaB [Gammaproteobacteria bacterium]